MAQRRTVLARRPRKRSSRKPASAYPTRMSPYQIRNACASPMSRRTVSRRVCRARNGRRRFVERCIWSANPRPNRTVNMIMNLPVAPWRIRLSASRSRKPVHSRSPFSAR
jgi:hypothetical protein